MTFPASKLSVGGKSLSDISRDDLKAALAKYCAPGFKPIDGISVALGRWESVGIHCGKPADKAGSRELMLSLDLYRPRPVGKREGDGNDFIASPQKRAAEVKGRAEMASRYDEAAGVLIYLGGPTPEKTMAGLVQEK